MPKFRYVGPLDEVEVVVRVKRGEAIDVPDGGRPYSEKTDDDGVVLEVDLGRGFAAQPDTWELVTRTTKPKGA